MSRRRKKNLKDIENLTAQQKKVAEEIQKLTDNYLNNSELEFPVNPRGSGLYGTAQQSRKLKYSASPREQVNEFEGAYITLGGDKVSGAASGKSGKGATNSARIDLVVGRLSPERVKDGQNVDNSFQSDAARIYISQLTDIDANFGIDPGKTGYLSSRSAIGIKADGVRIIGREGVKIVTGRMQGTNEKNSLGGKFTPAPMIELIAGNNTERRRVAGSILSGDGEMYDPLQGVAMGENVVKALKEMLDIQQDLIGVARKQRRAQKVFNIALQIACALPPALAGPAIAAAYSSFLGKDISNNIQLWRTSIKSSLFRINYLSPIGYRYIESRNVKTT